MARAYHDEEVNEVGRQPLDGIAAVSNVQGAIGLRTVVTCEEEVLDAPRSEGVLGVQEADEANAVVPEAL